jgi:hypothetical protein
MKLNSRINLSQGFINGGCLLLMVMIALLWGGGQGLYTAFKNRQPLVITCQEYLDQRPSAEWVTITEARFDFLNSAVSQSKIGDRTTEVFIPLRGKAENPDREIQLLLASKKPETISLMENMSANFESAKTPSDIRPEFMKKIAEVQTVSGLIRFGINADSKTEQKLAKLNLPLAKNFVMLNEGDEPSLAGSGLAFGLGLLLLAYQIRKATRTPDSPPPPPNLPPRVESPPSLPAR